MDTLGLSCVLCGLLFTRTELLGTPPRPHQAWSHSQAAPWAQASTLPICFSPTHVGPWVMAEGHGSGPAQCQRPGESGRRRKVFKCRLILGKSLTLPKGVFPHLYPEGNEPMFFQGPSCSEKFCDCLSGTLELPRLRKERTSQLMERKVCARRRAGPQVRALLTPRLGGALTRSSLGSCGLGFTYLGLSLSLLTTQASVCSA